MWRTTPTASDHLTLILRDQGHRVDSVRDGQEALSWLRGNPSVDLILLNLRISQLNAGEFRRTQLEDPRLALIPVVVLTEGGDLGAEVDSLGHVGFLQKPGSSQTVAEMIQRFARLRKPEILVVEDDPGVALMLERALRYFGFFPRVVNRGRTALEAYRRHQATVDLVVLDVQMPDLDGPQTLAAIRQINPQVQAVFMSGNIGKYTTEELLALGAIRVFQKPFILSQFSDALWALVGERRQPP